MKSKRKKTTAKPSRKRKKSSSKQHKPKSRKKAGVNKRKKKPTSRASQRFIKIQRILSEYTKRNGIKLGKNFNKYASTLNKKYADKPIKFISQNIDVIYYDTFGVLNIERQFSESFPFFRFIEEVGTPEYNNVKISIKFNDGTQSFDFEGFSDDAISYYESEMHTYLRQNYNDSPPAHFVITNTDKKSFIHYTLDTGFVSEAATDTQKTEETKPQPKETAKPSEIQLEIEREKTKQKKLESIDSAMRLLDKGLISKEEFNQIMSKI